MSNDAIRRDVYSLVLAFFHGDGEKAELWMNEANPLLGRVRPNDMIAMGRGQRLLRWVEERLGENETPTNLR